MLNIAVLVSGGGTNLQAIVDGIASGEIQNGKVALVIADRPGCYAEERAERHGIKHLLLDRKSFESNHALNRAIERECESEHIDLIVLAGYLSILDDKIVQKYRNRIMNIHPSLIPSFCGGGFYGLRVHQAAVDYGVKVSGATVHFVDEGTDTGAIILQQTVPVEPTDSAEDLQKRILTVEHQLLPAAVKLFCQGKIVVKGRKVFIQ